MTDAMRAEGARTILLVEDDPADRYLVQRLLRGLGRTYVVREALSGREGLAILRSERIDCVLLDFFLPDMEGIDFLRQLRSDSSIPPVPITVITGNEDDEVASLALKTGAEDYLVKDAITGRGLARVIENAIDKFRIRRELEASRVSVELQNRRLELLRDELQARVAELADATRAKDRFLAVMSHEMRTPLNAILGYADLLDMGVEGSMSESQRQYVERMRVGSRHLLDLINDVIDLTRADARRLELDVRAVDLGAVIEEVVALLDGQATERGIQLVVEPTGPQMPMVQADLHRLRQVLTNLIGNALKFTDEGSVRVRVDEPDETGTVTVQVIDTGIGIEPGVLPLVFNEFYQARDGLTRRHGGSGLGLAISRRLTLLMGGELEASSIVGEGSTFTLRLPIAAPGSTPRSEDVNEHAKQMAARAAAPERRMPPAVSVVAFAENRHALAELERRVSPRVRLRWTTDPNAVPGLAREEQAALVVLDVGSAGGAAWQAAAMMQDVADLTSTAVLLLPSLSSAIPDEAAEVLDLGWVSLVPKPFTAEQLTTAVVSAAEHGAEEAPRERAYEALVVDDDPDSRRVAARFLAQATIKVQEAPDGESALMRMRARLPDVVVLDLMMPVLDGFGVLAAMRADPLLASIPTVVLTAKSLTDAERQFLSRTAARVLQKGEHRLADVAALVLRAASGSRKAAETADTPG